jgi:hypothetical protein
VRSHIGWGFGGVISVVAKAYQIHLHQTLELFVLDRLDEACNGEERILLQLVEEGV